MGLNRKGLCMNAVLTKQTIQTCQELATVYASHFVALGSNLSGKKVQLSISKHTKGILINCTLDTASTAAC
jgi:hypothetical protein